MLKGKYIFRSNGEILFEGENIITQNGALMINKYLSNSAVDWAGSIGIGVLYTNSASTDTKLAYEIYRTPITLKSYLTSSGSNQIALKATLDKDLSAQIYEIGVFPLNYIGGADKDNFVITKFDETDITAPWYIGPSESVYSQANLTSTNSRIGLYNAVVPSGSTLFKSCVLDLSNYNQLDYLDFLYYISASMTSPSLVVKFYDNNNYTWTSSTTLTTPSAGYYSASLSMSSIPTSGYNYSFINKIAFQLLGGSGSVEFDCLKFMSGAAKPAELKLVSRKSASAALITKTKGQPVDVEYYLTVT